MEYAFLIYVEDFLNFVKFIEENSDLKLLSNENELCYALRNCCKLDIRDECRYEPANRSFIPYCLEKYGININTILYFWMVNNEDIDSRIWGPETMSLLKTVMKNFNGDGLLYANGYGVPIMLRKDGTLIVDSNNLSSRVFNFDLLDIPYTDKVIEDG
ncbi:MAG: hypothetical protein LBR54_01550 [Oscillospiraceae bacterium]|jgi:hypothetical protein|nr:hypothetical protein [Oscillospiraceae bacterium]